MCLKFSKIYGQEAVAQDNAMYYLLQKNGVWVACVYIKINSVTMYFCLSIRRVV